MEKKQLLCGFGQADITPVGKIPLYGQFYQRIPTHARDPLHATVLAMDSGDDFLIWVSLDFCRIHQELAQEVADCIGDRIPGLTRERLIINATHIHTSPYIPHYYAPGMNTPFAREVGPFATPAGCQPPEDYLQNELVPKIAQAVLTAWDSRRDTGVAPGFGHACVGYNRMVLYKGGIAKMYGSVETVNFDQFIGTTDHGVEMLFFFQADELAGVIINLACPSQILEHQSFYTADYWGEVRRQLNGHFGRNIFVLAQCASAGDQSPRDLTRREKGVENYDTEEFTVEIGSRIVSCVLQAYARAKESVSRDVEFSHEYERTVLPLRCVNQAEIDTAQKEYDAVMQGRTQFGELTEAERETVSFPAGVLRRAAVQAKRAVFEYDSHVVRIGDCAFATYPFELYLEYGMRIRARARARQVFNVQLACDSAGYLPSRAAVNAGGYSAVVSVGLVGPAGGDQLVEETVDRINRLFTE